jgi:hypothetical protein
MKLLGMGFVGMWVWFCIQNMFNTYLFGDKFSMMFWLMVGLNASLYRIYKESSNIPGKAESDRA